MIIRGAVCGSSARTVLRGVSPQSNDSEQIERGLFTRPLWEILHRDMYCKGYFHLVTKSETIK